MGNKALPSIRISTPKAEKEHVTSTFFSAGLKTAGKKESYKDQIIYWVNGAVPHNL